MRAFGLMGVSGTPTYNLLEWARLVSYGMEEDNTMLFGDCYTHETSSSAKDQLTGQAVAVKKIMKPFSTPVLAKRTYRELKLLKHLRHENVGIHSVRIDLARSLLWTGHQP